MRGGAFPHCKAFSAVLSFVMPNNWADSAFQEDSSGPNQGTSLIYSDRTNINTFPTSNM